MIESALGKFLLTEPDVTDLVGRRITRERRRADRKHTAPEEGPTAITIGRISTNRQYSLTGPEIGTADVLLRIEAWAKGDNCWPLVDVIFETLRNLLPGVRREWEGVYVQGCTIENEGTDAEAPIDASDYWDANYGFDLRVHHLQPAQEIVEP